MYFEKRLRRLGSMLDGLDCVITTSLEDIRYYTGYKPDGGILLVFRDGKATYFTSALDNEAESLKGISVEFTGDVKGIKKQIHGTAGFDENKMSARTLLKLKKAGIGLKPVSDIFSRARAIKDEAEIALIRKAVSITRHGFDVQLYGKTEAKAASDVAAAFIKHGSDVQPAFEPIIASGPNSYFIHHTPGKRKIRKGELVVQDCGARYQGYCADVTRTLSEGCGKREKAMIEDVLEIKAEVTGHAVKNATMKQLRGVYERMMKRKHHKVLHSIGHGVGLSAHEAINWKLEKGMVITVEPGIYEKRTGGCRIEDMILITGSKPVVLSKKITQA